jgi:hypothetical protein
MSNKQNSQNTQKNNTIHIIALIIVIALIIFIPAYIFFSKDINLALEEVWGHLEKLSLMIVSYLFGVNKSK